ncbi:MAG: transcription antitermination factor NusB [Fidelibacterota bacterium]
MIHSRRQAREFVLQALYAYEFTHDKPKDIIARLKERNEDTEVDEETEEYMWKLFSTTLAKQDWTSVEIKRRLQNWEYDRVALIDRLVLQMMITEMVFFEDIPPKVSISEGVEISKKYSTPDSGGFVNGILDSIYHSLDTLSTH